MTSSIERTDEFGMLVSFVTFSTRCEEHDNNVNNLDFVTDEIYRDYEYSALFAVLFYLFLPQVILALLE
jgi:hypothetical protein